MTAGGLTKFIHGTQQGTSASPRRIPQKLVLEDANKIYKYASAESSSSGTQRGAFSTDLGSYPDTSLDEIQDPLEDSIHERSTTSLPERHGRPSEIQDTGKSIENHTAASIQQEVPGSHIIQAENVPSVIRHDAAVSALIGAGNIQEYEDFLQAWTTNEDYLGNPLGDVLPSISRSQLPNTFPLTTEPAASNNTSPCHPFTQESHRSPTTQQYRANGLNNLVENDLHRESLSLPLRQLPIATIFQSQVLRQDERDLMRLPHDYKQLPALKTTIDQQRTPEQDVIPSTQHAISVSPSQPQSISDRWSLKRPANLDSVILDLTKQQILLMEYSSLIENYDESKAKDSAAFFADLDHIVSKIIDKTLHEETLHSHLVLLNQDGWVALGDQIQSRLGDSVNELKLMYAKKQDMLKTYQEEIGDLVKQIKDKDKITTAKLQRLRSFGAQILDDKDPV